MARIIARTKVKPPGAPTVTALSTSELRAVFTAPAGFNIASFLPQFSFDGVIWEALATSTTGTVSRTGLNPNTRGYFRAAAVDAVGSASAYGTIASAFTDASAASGAPSLSLALSGSTAINVTIAATPAATKSIIYYEVQRSLTGTGGWSDVSLTETDAASEIPAQITSTPNKWVDASGSYQGNGAFTTIQAAFDTLNPGDHLAIAPGTYAERAVLTRSGTLAQPIIIRCADYSNRPTIDGEYSSTIIPGWQAPFTPGMTQLLTIQSNYVTVDGINLIRSRSGGILVGDGYNNSAFLFPDRVNTFWFGNKVIRCSVIGCETAFRTINPDGCDVYGCTFLDCQQAYFRADGFPEDDPTWGSAVSLMGKNITFVENLVGQSSGEGIHAGVHIGFGGGDGYAFTQCENLVLRNNRVFDCWSAAVYLSNIDGGVVERNVVYNSGDTRYWQYATSGYPKAGMSFASESGDPSVGGVLPENLFIGARDVVVRNNIVTGYLVCFDFADWPSQATTRIKILNNTFYRSVGGTFAAGASLIKNAE